MSRRSPARPGRALGLAAWLGIVLLVVLPLAGCGKRNRPQPPPGEPVTYPRVYPSA
jgi:hypothetical protein